MHEIALDLLILLGGIWLVAVTLRPLGLPTVRERTAATAAKWDREFGLGLEGGPDFVAPVLFGNLPSHEVLDRLLDLLPSLRHALAIGEDLGHGA